MGRHVGQVDVTVRWGALLLVGVVATTLFGLSDAGFNSEPAYKQAA